MDLVIKSLLSLQEKDLKRHSIKTQLESLPHEIKALQDKIEGFAEKTALKKKELKELEVERKAVDGELKKAEAAIVKFKTQQIQVKKAEEYDAFTKEIETQKKLVDQAEDRELELLELIEAKEKSLQCYLKEEQESVSSLQNQIKRLEAQKEELELLFKEWDEAFKKASEKVESVFLKKYEELRAHIRGPLVVALEAGRCKGCYLKVSSNVAQSVRQEKELQQCDNCLRILYWPNEN